MRKHPLTRGAIKNGSHHLLAARVRPGQRVELLRALQEGSFGAGFPYGDLREMLRASRVDRAGTLRWVEVCYRREFYGVALHEELAYLEEYLTDIEIADARNPRDCKGYPECNDCACTHKVLFDGEPLLDHRRRTAERCDDSPRGERRPTRWLGWRGRVTADEERLNQV